MFFCHITLKLNELEPNITLNLWTRETSGLLSRLKCQINITRMFFKDNFPFLNLILKKRENLIEIRSA